MQRNFLFFLFIILSVYKVSAQTIQTDKQIMDSLLENDDMLKLINNLDKPYSYFRINMGVGNKLYNSLDNSVENLQKANSIIFTPSLGYYNKSGLGVSFTGFLMNENNRTDFYQYAVTPSFIYSKGKVVDLYASFTHYILKDAYSPSTSPVQNEWYAMATFKQSWVKPRVALSYSTGIASQVINIDTAINVLNQPIKIKYIDTAGIKISSFSVTASLEHSFSFFNLFSINDGLIFTPQVSLISGVNNFNVSHNSSLENFNAFTKKQIKRIRHFQAKANNDQYQLQSAGLDLDVIYSIGRFYLEPDLYLNYYLPQTNDKAFTQIVTFNAGITF